ncbi:hypothetical protein ACFSCV_05275 [Methylopila henanensis]|uniref:Capsule biosynthesis protein n=1 Tax=Methylopila henanensis TaxID=873516 RepID=A0ABW4K5S5_9HYPH
MTDTNVMRSGGPATQLGARARTILKSLAENAPARAAAVAPATPSVAPAADAAPAPASQGAAVAAAPAAEPAPGKIVALPRRQRNGAPKPSEGQLPRPAARPVAAKAKRSLLKISAMLAIGLPTALATVYYGLIASPQYIAEAKFAVRGAEESSAGAMAGGLSQLAGLSTAASTASDSFIVAQFVESRQLVDSLQKSVDLRSAYTRDGADFLARYRPYGTDDTSEHLAGYWNSVSHVYYEPISGIISFNVRAFTREDALKIARETVRESEELVNKLSARAREDAIFDSKQELSRAELRLKFARKAIQDFRDREGAVDPAKSAESQLTIVSTLEADLAKQEADMASATAFLSKDAPTVRVMRNKIDALKRRIEIERAKIGSLEAQAKKETARPLLSTSFSEFEELQTERDFAQKSYEAALASVESARMRAERQSRYLATFVEPRLPEDSMYPLRMQSILLVALCAAIAWAIGVLVFYGIRDHSA